MLAVLLASLLPVATTAALVIGVDVSAPVGEKAWACLQQPGGQGAVQFAIVRAGRSSGTVDPAAAETILAAHRAGLTNVDAYLFPCVPCGNASGQVEQTVANLRASGAEFGRLWLDIERYRWSTNLTVNQAFVLEMVAAAARLNVRAGVYSGYSSWSAIVGAAWNGAAHLPLWYAHYDGNTSFADWNTTEHGGYGGWHAPSIKQYLGDKTSCGIGIDYNARRDV